MTTGNGARHLITDGVADGKYLLETTVNGESQGAHGLALISQQLLLDSLALLGGQDRKSTRLNSSHANISYAVFCLKKKKHQTRDSYNDANRQDCLDAPT